MDIWDFFDSRPIRIGALALGFMFLVFSLATSYGREASIIVLAVLTIFTIGSIKRHPREGKNWFFTLALLASIILLIIGGATLDKGVWRESSKQPNVTRIPPTEWPYAASDSDISPVVVMLASGGGSRAAVYTALTLQKLHEDFPGIASKLNAISSVSGGSLATASYVSRRYRSFCENSRSNEFSGVIEAVSQNFPDSPSFPNFSGSLTWVFYRDGIYGLEEFLPKFDPFISSVVRASANFPFGFPLVRIETTRPLRFNPCAEKRASGTQKYIKLTDGGVLSNSGMWSLFSLLMNEDKREGKRGQLQQRGVLLIVVEAGKMPEYRDDRRSISSLYGTIGDSNPMGQALHKRMYDILANKYGSKLAVVQIDLTPESDMNVLTTWALDKRSFDKLKQSFDDSWSREKATIIEKWRSIQADRSFPALHIPATNRPPLS